MDENEAGLVALERRFPGIPCDVGASGEPRYHVFHAPNSVCSQKVRTVLFEAGVPFISHIINIFGGESYEPAYVKTRAHACLDSGLAFSARHTGSTSVVGTGCDACVVPTVIDGESGEVLVDSLKICLELAQRFAGSLRPADLAKAIDREIAICDSLPNYPLLAARAAPPTPIGGNTFAMGKVDRCNALIAEHAGDPILVKAYTAKRDKEQSANADLFSAEAIGKAERLMQFEFHALAGRLPAERRFLFGDTLTLADIFWAIELIRTDDIGYGYWIDENPRLRAYYEALSGVPSIRAAIIEWPGARIELPPRS